MTFRQLLAKHKQGRISKKILEKAKENLREYNTHEGWHETITEEWKEALNQIGFPDAEIHFSGFACQGDGACFTCKYVNVTDLLDFLGTKRQANPAITYDGKQEDFRGWILHKLGWKGQDDNHRFQWLADIADQISATVTHDGRYYHEQSASLTAEFYGPETVETAVEEFRKCAEDLRRWLSKAIYKDLEAQYDYLTSDEGFLETDTELNRDGEIMN